MHAYTSTTYPPRQMHEPNTHAPQQKLSFMSADLGQEDEFPRIGETAVGFILMLICMRIHVERNAETKNRNRTSTKNAAKKHRQQFNEKYSSVLTSC